MFRRLRHAELPHLRVGEDLIEAVDWAARHAGFVEGLYPFGGSAPGDTLADRRVQRVAMCGTQFVIGVVGVGDQFGVPMAWHSRSKSWPEAAMLMWPSAVLNTPVGIAVGWLLPACSGTSWLTSQRAAWKSVSAIKARSSEVCTHCPSPVCSRSSSASTMPNAQ